MKWIKYNVYQNTINTGTESSPVYEDILLEKKICYSEVNLAIAEEEAYNGEYTIEEDSTLDIKPCLPQAFASYLTFAGNVNANMVSAAFGKGNEDIMTGLGKALAMYGWFKGDDKTTYPFTNLQKMLSINDINHDIYNEIIASANLSAFTISNAYALDKIYENYSCKVIYSMDATTTSNEISITLTDEDLACPFRASASISFANVSSSYTHNGYVYINGVALCQYAYGINGASATTYSKTRELHTWSEFGITSPGTYVIKTVNRLGAANGNSQGTTSVTIYKAKESYEA